MRWEGSQPGSINEQVIAQDKWGSNPLETFLRLSNTCTSELFHPREKGVGNIIPPIHDHN
jgi:hypothetical protein